MNMDVDGRARRDPRNTMYCGSQDEDKK